MWVEDFKSNYWCNQWDQVAFEVMIYLHQVRRAIQNTYSKVVFVLQKFMKCVVLLLGLCWKTDICNVHVLCFWRVVIIEIIRRNRTFSCMIFKTNYLKLHWDRSNRTKTNNLQGLYKELNHIQHIISQNSSTVNLGIRT